MSPPKDVDRAKDLSDNVTRAGNARQQSGLTSLSGNAPRARSASFSGALSSVSSKAPAAATRQGAGSVSTQPSQSFEKKNLESAYEYLQSMCPDTKGGGIEDLRHSLPLELTAKLDDLATVIHAMGSRVEGGDGDLQMLGDVKAKLASFVSAEIKQHVRGNGNTDFKSTSYASLCKSVADLGCKLGGESIVNHFRENLVNPALADTVQEKYGDAAAKDPRALLNQHAGYAMTNLSEQAVKQFGAEKRSPHVAIHQLATALQLEAKADRLLREPNVDRGKDSPPADRGLQGPTPDHAKLGGPGGDGVDVPGGNHNTQTNYQHVDLGALGDGLKDLIAQNGKLIDHLLGGQPKSDDAGGMAEPGAALPDPITIPRAKPKPTRGAAPAEPPIDHDIAADPCIDSGIPVEPPIDYDIPAEPVGIPHPTLTPANEAAFSAPPVDHGDAPDGTDVATSGLDEDVTQRAPDTGTKGDGERQQVGERKPIVLSGFNRNSFSDQVGKPASAVSPWAPRADSPPAEQKSGVFGWKKNEQGRWEPTVNDKRVVLSGFDRNSFKDQIGKPAWHENDRTVFSAPSQGLSGASSGAARDSRWSALETRKAHRAGREPNGSAPAADRGTDAADAADPSRDAAARPRLTPFNKVVTTAGFSGPGLRSKGPGET